MLYLIISIALLLLSPWISLRFNQRFHQMHLAMQWFLAICISYLSFVHILPTAFKIIGWVVIPVAMLGFLLVTVTERFWIGQKNSSIIFLALAFLGICLHSMMDGATLAFGNYYLNEQNHFGKNYALILLVLVHQLPVGIFLWTVALEKFSQGIAWAMMVCMSLTTSLGFFAAQDLTYSVIYQPSFHYFQAFVVGSLLHIAFEPLVHGKKHACHCPEDL